jgi:hypothetical protein
MATYGVTEKGIYYKTKERKPGGLLIYRRELLLFVLMLRYLQLSPS